MYSSVLPLIAAAVLSSVSDSSEGIAIDAKARTRARSEMFRFSVGSDRAKIFLRDEHQRDLKVLQDAVGYRYLRCHGIFNEEMNIVRRLPDGSLQFDWTLVDQFIDQLAKVKLKPFVEFGFMPEPLASGKQTIFYWRGNVTPPKSQAEWGLLVSEFLKHQIKRRGLREVRSWYFEVWNEPNLDGFWTGGQAGYWKLYETAARAVKSVDSKLRVGGPATAGMGWIPEFLEYCAKNQVPVDFVASHSYAAYEGFLDEKGRGGTTLATNADSLYGEFARAHADIKKSAFPKIPLFITEWGPSYSPRDPIHDSYVCAPFILEKVHQCRAVVDGMSYWAFSDQFEEPGAPNEPFHGGFGLLTVDGLPKPAFFAYRFLSELFRDQLPVDAPRTLATKKGSELRILTWDYQPPKQDVPNQPFYHRDLPSTALPDLVLNLSGLRPGRYSVQWEGVGYQRNDLYGAYMALGKPKGNRASLSPEIQAKLRAAVSGKEIQTAEIEVGKDGRTVLRTPMRTNDVWLIRVKPVR